MSQLYKICPICSTPNQRNTTSCINCGASLNHTSETPSDKQGQPNRIGYQHTHGETDLLEKNLHWKGSTYILIFTAATLLLICTGAFLLTTRQLTPSPATTQPTTPLVAPSSPTIMNQITPTIDNTTIQLATVTQGSPTLTVPPSPTITPTQGPCTQEVQAGDTLIAILIRCGHRDQEPIMSTVVELNNLRDPASIQQGQVIEIPWPTPTTDPNITPTETIAEDTSQTITTSNTGDTIIGVQQVPTETLQPGVTWHTIQKDENIIIIAVQYGATLRILSDLNPEVTFSQCDFGFDSGGPTCIVQIYEGQRIRVPAPTPVPTIPPTPSGSETPTPTATATFNAPNILSPSDRAFFTKDDLITLRWVATGALSENEAYLVRVEDQTARKTYTATTQELSFIIPEEWHGQDNIRHEYRWTISVININNPDDAYFSTSPRTFTWQGQGE